VSTVVTPAEPGTKTPSGQASIGNRSGDQIIKVAFDTLALHPRYRHHGIQVYSRHLLAAFKQMASAHSMEVRPFVSTSDDSAGNTHEEQPGFRPRSTFLLKFERLWRYGGASAMAFVHGADVAFNPAGTSVPIKGLVPTVTTIHDLTPVVMPSYSRRIASFLKVQLRWAARFSAAIITVSECSRKDIVRICGVPESRIKVIYEGHDRSLFNDSTPDPDLRKMLLSRLTIEKPYILHHGAVQPRKNLKRLIEAYRMMLSRNHNLDFDLVLAGPLAWQFEETVAAARNNAGCCGRVVLAGPLSDEDLVILIKGASLEVIPSLYEGFCLPMVEAMACGVPTIASNNSCLPEISGGVLRYFDPQSIEEMSACMEDVLENQSLRVELARKGKARAQDFDWQRCAEETLAVLASAARRKHGSGSH